jgi:hypothetical protein
MGCRPDTAGMMYSSSSSSSRVMVALTLCNLGVGEGEQEGGGFIMEVAEAEGVSGPLWMNKEGGRGWRGRRRSNKA